MFTRLFTRFRPLVTTLTALALTGCAVYGPSDDWMGRTLNDVTLQLGQASVQKSTATGSRLTYAKGPFGLHTYMIDFDQNGIMVQWRQVLTEETFLKVVPGMNGAAVEDLIGPSREKTRLGRNRGEVWSYRYETPFCIWFQVELDNTQVVRSAGHGIPPECARHDDWL